MFNKPNLTSRNEILNRKDIGSVIPAASNSPLTESKATLDTVAASPAPAPGTGMEQSQGARLIVGPDVKLKGAEINDCDTLVVEGRVEATMDSRVIRIADKGAFSGKVSIDIAEIHGSFDGELTARSQLIIHATGKVSGKIRYGKLVIDEGGELCGDINAISAENRGTHHRLAGEFVPVLNAVAG